MATELERASYEKGLAQNVADEYKADVDAEHVPDSKEYDLIAKALHLTLDVHMLYADQLLHFYLNPGQAHVVKVFLSSTGGHTQSDGKGHFDFIVATNPDLTSIASDADHSGWGA